MTLTVCKMKRDELIEHLTMLGLMFSPEMTVPELRTILMESRDGPVEKSALTGLSSKNKTELKEMCMEYGIPTTGNEVNGKLMIKIREHVERKTDGKSETKVGFGKHS